MEDSCCDSREVWMWIGIAVGVALGTAGVVYLMRRTDAPRHMEKLLRRCEDRIHNIESALTGLESSLSSSQA
jgi:hypothetical protein